MESFNSGFYSSMFQHDHLETPMSSVLNYKVDFLGNSELVDINGNVILESVPHVAGGEMVTFPNGETAHVKENVYDGYTIDFAGVENDIVSRPTIFDGQSFSQQGENIGTLEPNFMGNGFDFTSPTEGTIFSTSTDAFGDTQVTIDSPLIDSSISTGPFDLQNSFSEIETVSSQISAVDLGAATDALDGLDVLGFF